MADPGGAMTLEQVVAHAVNVLPAAPSAPAARPPPVEVHDWEEGSPVPLLDTDNQSILEARWINSTDSQFLGETIDGIDTPQPGLRRTDVDWWRFRLTFSPATATKIDFDVQKDTWDAVDLVVYSFPSVEVLGDSRVMQYVLMNASQGMGTPTHITFTAFEDASYYMLLQTVHIGSSLNCCRVNYTITNIAFSTATPIDDNNNVTRSEAYSAGSPPTNREVDQNTDLYDVFDLTGQFTIDGSKDDEAYVTLDASVSQGRNGTTDWFNGSANAAEDGDTVSVATMYLIYRDKSNYWHMASASALPGQNLHIETLINGTPAYAVFSTYSAVVQSGGSSSIPGWVRYSVTGLSIQEDHSPRPVGTIPTQFMYEDDAPSGANLVNLESYFTDDFDDGALRFTVVNVLTTSMTVTINGSWLSAAPSASGADYAGTFSVRVMAWDRGRDRGFNTPDDLSVNSNFFSIVVQPSNDVPTITSFGGQANTGGSLSFVLAQGDVRPYSSVAQDPDDSTFTWSYSPSLSFASFDSNTGVLTLSPQNRDFGNYSVTLRVFDPTFANSSMTLNFRVDNRNDPPRFDNITVNGTKRPVALLGGTVFNATEGVQFTMELEVADMDWDIGMRDALNYVCDKTYFTIVRDSVNARIARASFTPTNAMVGTLIVRCSVGDGPVGLFQDNISVPISVHNVNQAPIFTQVGTTTGVIQLQGSKSLSFDGLDGAIQGREFGITVRASDIDVEAAVGDSLTFTTDKPGKFRVTPNADGLSADIAFTPNSSDATVGSIVVTVYVNDVGLSDMLTITIDIGNVNDPPVLVAVLQLNMTEDVPFAYTFEASDPDNDPISFQTDSTLFVVDSTGSVEMTPTNELIQGKNLNFEVLVTARDNHGGITTMTVHVSVRNVNDAPSTLNLLSPEENSRHAAGESITLTGSAKDVDDGDETGLVYRWYVDEVLVGEGKAITTLLSNDNTTAVSRNVRMEVVDSHGGSTNKTVMIFVEGKPVTQPGFEGAAAAMALAGAAVAAVALARRRRN